MFVGGTPIGAPVIGWLGEHVGPRSTLVVGGLGRLAAALAAAWLLARRTGRLPRLGARREEVAAPVPVDVVR